MTDNGALVIKKQDPLVEFDGERYSKMIGRLKNMIVGGKKLKDHEVEALAGASLATGLNPFAKEIYFVPGIGPEIGKQGYARKAQEQLEYEAERVDYRNPVTISVKTRQATRDEVGKDLKDGDIAIHVTLTDSLTKSEWLGKLMEFKQDFGPEMAIQIVGDQPSWTGVGVVHATENFGKEMYARAERAEKRATKQAMLKRFPRLELPDLTRVMAEMPEYTVEEVEEPVKERKTADQLSEELGFDTTPKQRVTREDVQPEPVYVQPEPVYEDIVEGEVVEEEGEEVVNRWNEAQVKAIMAAGNSFKDVSKVVPALNRSRYLKGHESDGDLQRWAFKYCEARKEQNNEAASALLADGWLMDLHLQEEE